MAKKPKKGVAGKNTGPAARRAIAAARKRGATTADIARAARRDEKVIGLIEKGGIANPPANVAGMIRKAKPSKTKPTKKSQVNVAKFKASRKKHS